MTATLGGARLSRWCLVGLVFASGCGDDSSPSPASAEPYGFSFEVAENCSSLEDCPRWTTLEQGLERAAELCGEFDLEAILVECEDSFTVRIDASGLSGDAFSYDKETGELIQFGSYSDQLSPDVDYSKLPSDDWIFCDYQCKVCGDDSFGNDPCTGSLAEPFVAQCRAAMPDLPEECAACACEHCYPVAPWQFREKDLYEYYFFTCVEYECAGCGAAICEHGYLDTACDAAEEP